MLEFIPSQRAFIKQICDRSKRVILAYQFDKNAYYDANSLILEENLNFLRRLVDNVEYVSVNEDKTHEILYSFPSPDEEVKAIGQMIRDTISKEHCLNWEDFLVVFPDMLSYRVFVQRIFTRLEIPFCMTPGYVLGQDPSMVALVSFMEWIAYPSWEGLMSMFTSPFFSFDAQETKQFSRTSREIFKAIGFFPSQAWSRNWKNWKRIEKARKIMSSKKTQSITNWVDCFKQSMELVGWKSFDNEGAIGLMRIFNDLADDTSVDLSMFKNIFKSALNLTEVEKSRGKGVRVMGVLDSMGVEAKIVFFGGATDDNLPMSAKREEFFLPDALKRDLNLADYELKIARERLDLYRLKKTGKKIVFTYPVRMNGRQKNRSIMLHGLSENPVSAEYVTSSRITIFLSGVSHEKFFERFLKNDILNFTVSQIDDLSKCPYRFYLRYVEHIEPYKSPVIEERPEFWGNLLHTAAEKSAYEFIGKIQDSSIIKAQYDSFYGFVNEFLEKPENMSSQYGYVLPAAVRAFLEKRKPYVFKAFENLLKKHQGHRIIEVEAKHAIRIGNMAITGKFDRVEETEDGLVEIIDYKSGKIPAVNKKYPESRNCLDLTNLELPLYGLIKYKNDGICPGIVVWAFNFEETHDEKYYNQITEDFLKIFEEDLIKLGSDLKNQNFQFSPKNNCYSCPFNQFCMMKEGISDD